MVKKSLILAVALLVPLAAIGSATAEQGKPPEPAEAAEPATSGKVRIGVHSHSSGIGSPSGAELLVETDPIPFPVTEGAFSYSSVTCESPARFNDVGLGFNPDVAGVEDPASVRYVVEGTVTEVDESGEQGELEGNVTTFLCENGQRGDEIHIDYEGMFDQISDNRIRLTDATFEITGGTGRFAGLEGEGPMTGSFTCLSAVLQRADADNCAELGIYSDAVLQFIGQYESPTQVEPAPVGGVQPGQKWSGSGR